MSNVLKGRNLPVARVTNSKKLYRDYLHILEITQLF